MYVCVLICIPLQWHKRILDAKSAGSLEKTVEAHAEWQQAERVIIVFARAPSLDDGTFAALGWAARQFVAPWSACIRAAHSGQACARGLARLAAKIDQDAGIAPRARDVGRGSGWQRYSNVRDEARSLLDGGAVVPGLYQARGAA